MWGVKVGGRSRWLAFPGPWVHHVWWFSWYRGGVARTHGGLFPPYLAKSDVGPTDVAYPGTVVFTCTLQQLLS